MFRGNWIAFFDAPAVHRERRMIDDIVFAAMTAAILLLALMPAQPWKHLL